MSAPIDDDPVAFPPLSDAELASLAALGTRRPVSPGDLLYQAGDASYDFFVILSGAVEIVLTSNGTEQLITRQGPRRFLGEMGLLTGQRVLVSARVAEAGEVVQIPREGVRRLIATSPTLGNKVLAAFMARRALLMDGAGDALQVIGSRFSPECLAVREFLTRLRIPHRWLDADVDEDVDALLRELSVSPDELPLVIAAGTVLRRPTVGELSEYLGLTLASLPERCFDLVVVGGGPAGLAAVVYGASEGLRTLGLEMEFVGGQASRSSRIENYLGFPQGVSGADLTYKAMVQAEKFNAHLSTPCTAAALSERAGHLVVDLSDGTQVGARAVIAASGARYRRLPADRLADFEGHGVHYSATKVEADLCTASPVVVVGGGNSAGQAAVYLAECGSPVNLVIRGPDLAAGMSRYLVDQVESDHRIRLRTRTTVVALDGDTMLATAVLRGPDGDEQVPCEGLFSFIGADPSSAWLSGCAALDKSGFVLSDRSLTDKHLGEPWRTLGRAPLPFETSRPGLFVAGDVRSGSVKRVAAAVGEGSSAVRSVHEFLAFSH